MEITRWVMESPGEALVQVRSPAPPLGADEALVRVAGCGVCHTDLGFWADGVPTRAALPLALGHEVSGFVADAGANAAELIGRAVVVPAVTPCGSCAACASGRGGVCRTQFMPGNDGHGGFASHVVVPSRGLCHVPDCESDDQPLGRAGVTLRQLSVLADAASTAWQAVLRSELGPGDAAVVVGAGGVGSFVLQLAKAQGASVVAVDVDERRRDAATELGADATVDAGDAKVARKAVRSALKELGAPAFGVRVFECSGHPAGQDLAFSLVGPAGTLMVVGYTGAKVELHLSRLMAMDARAIGTWGCDPDLYPDLLRKVLDGDVIVAPLVEEHPLDNVQAVLEALQRHELSRRAVLVPSTEMK